MTHFSRRIRWRARGSRSSSETRVVAECSGRHTGPQRWACYRRSAVGSGVGLWWPWTQPKHLPQIDANELHLAAAAPCWVTGRKLPPNIGEISLCLWCRMDDAEPIRSGSNLRHEASQMSILSSRLNFRGFLASVRIFGANALISPAKSRFKCMLRRAEAAVPGGKSTGLLPGKLKTRRFAAVRCAAKSQSRHDKGATMCSARAMNAVLSHLGPGHQQGLRSTWCWLEDSCLPR